MTFDQLEFEVKNQWPNPTIEQSIKPWLNDAILELASMYELPGLRLRTPATLDVTTSNYLYNLSAATHPSGYTYHKRVFRVSSATVQQGFGLESDPLWIEDTDPTHAEIGTEVQRVAIEGDQIIVFPRATENLSIFFYRRPIPMVAGNDVPDSIPDGYHFKVLVPMVILKSFRVFPSIDSETMGDNRLALAHWSARLNQGLYGDGLQVGLLPFINKSQRINTPRTRGPAVGSSLGGRW